MECDARRLVTARSPAFVCDFEGEPHTIALVGRSLFVVHCSSDGQGSSPVLLELDGATGTQRASVAIPLATLTAAWLSSNAELLFCAGPASAAADAPILQAYRRTNGSGELEVMYTLPAELYLGSSSDGSMVITQALPHDSVVLLRTAATGELVKTLSFDAAFHENVALANDVHLSHDNARLLMNMPYDDAAAELSFVFEIEACGRCKQAYVPKLDSAVAADAQFSNDGRGLFAVYDTAVAVHDVVTGAKLRQTIDVAGRSGYFWRSYSSPDGALYCNLTSVGNDRLPQLHLSRADTLEQVSELRTEDLSDISRWLDGGAVFSADGTRFAIICRETGTFKVFVWDISAEHAAHSPLALPVPPPSMPSELLTLLRSGTGCDVTLVAGCGVRFSAHRLILSLRSEKLRAQLGGAFADSAAAELAVPAEFSARCVQRLLEFLYSDALEVADIEEAKELLAAGGYFGVPRLQRLAESTLALGLTWRNAADVLLVADRHSASALRDIALRFVSRFPALVMQTDGWATLLAESPRLAADVLFAVAKGRPPARDETGDARAAAARAAAAADGLRLTDAATTGGAANDDDAAPGDGRRTRQRRQ